MNADEIVAYFVDEVDPVYDTRQDKGKKIYYACLLYTSDAADE